MALKRKKLDAICAHLKKTSAVDVNATTENGVQELPFANGLAPTAKEAAKPTSTTPTTTTTTANNNNNNEETAADLNETPESVPPRPSIDNDPPQAASAEGELSYQDSSQQAESSTSLASNVDAGSESLANSVADGSLPSSEPSGSASLLSSHAGASSIQLAGSGRRKSRKAAKPRLVFHAPEQLDSEEEEEEEGQGVEDLEDSSESSHLACRGENSDGLCDPSQTVPGDSFGEPRSPSPSSSGFASQYSLPQEPHQQQQQQSNESIGSFTNPSPTTPSPSSSLASVPLDLSTSRASDHSENLSADAFFFDNEDRDSTRPSTSPAPAQAAPMVVSAEAEGLADYATNTMNELLSIYGFGAAGLEGGDKQGGVPKELDLSLLRSQAPKVPPAHQGGGGGSGGGGVKGKAGYHSEALQKALLSSADSLSLSEGSINSSQTQTKEGNRSSTSAVSRGTHSTTKFKFHNVKPPPPGVKPGPSNNGGGTVVKISSSDYNKYIKKFHNGKECGGSHCLDLGYRDHYHCHDCNFKVFLKKEEMVRHYKWHRKRDESLQHGFLRYSPLDDCSIKFGHCTHNKRQTHYHCIQAGCDKVYISTSDVQMHANYHRKDSAIIQEGFQRFRATEDCGTTTCSFYAQRTTHFHCRRSNCHFTFKHKADMEKHKSYHQKDEILGRDGFKKFMKYEHCSYNSCRFSKISNHIHCIRSGCNYVLHSTAQLYSHKRKHERREFENVYRTYRQIQRPSIQPSSNQVQASPRPPPAHADNGGLPAGAIPLMSKVNLSSIPLQGYVEPMVVAGQNLQRLPIPIKLEGRAGAVLAPNVTVVSAGAQTLSLVSNPTTVAPPQPLALTTVAASHKSSCAEGVGGATPKTESSQASTPALPQVRQTQPQPTQRAAPSHTPKQPQTVHIKQEPKSDVESDVESSQPGKKQQTGGAPVSSFSPSARLGKVKEEELNGSLNLSIPSAHHPPQLLQVPRPLLENSRDAKSAVASDLSLATAAKSSAGVDAGPLPPPPLLTLRPPTKKVGAPEKRERDESWKNYLIRYTANDPCHSRCQLLYKDHYHCKIPGCQVLFRSKDGVREHAKFHDLQERITPMVYEKYESTQACPDQGCQYSTKQSHYHCNWTGCKQAIPEGGQTFARLEHYRIHEYAKVSAGKNYRAQSGSAGLNQTEDLAHRRRGRPPKYPRLDVPLVPKVELTEQEITESLTKSGEEVGEERIIINGFKKFDASDPCPDTQCMYRSQVHYHCGRPRCHTSTDRIDVLNLHAKDFHSFVNILDHFEFFDRSINCRRAHCSNNRTNRHFHCTQPRCDYSFVRHSTMAQHHKKHHGEASAAPKPAAAKAPSSTPLSPGTRITPIQLLRRPDGQTYIPIVPALDKSVVKAAGTFYPLSGLPPTAAVSATPIGMITSQGQPLTSTLTLTIPANLVSAGIPVMAPMASGSVLSTANTMVPIIAGSLVTATAVSSSSAPPLTVLLQQKSDSALQQPSWSAMRNSMHFSLQVSCGRPFCKLKKKDHYHCVECNQAFSDPARLRGHITKHGMKFKKLTQAHSNASLATATATAAAPFATKVQASEPDPEEMGLDLSTGKGKEVQTLKAEGEGGEEDKGEENVDEGVDDDNDSLSSSLNLSMSKITNCIAPRDSNAVVDLSETSNKAPLIIDEHTNQSDDESADVSMNGNNNDDEDDDEGLLDMSLPASSFATSSPTTSRRSGRKRSAPNHYDFVPSDDASLIAKQMKLKLSAPIPSTLPTTTTTTTSTATATPSAVTSTIPEGFIRIKCGTDCCYSSCNYRHSVSHFHCLRPECGYGFSDKSRMENHLDRHKRLDKLMGEEFRQFRATVDCGRGDCEFSRKASHFHCEKCAFVCADSSKVLAHRKYHAKMDNISKNGFQKFGALQSCGVLMCSYSRKHTHYHCLHEGCNHAVLGPAQMAPHKLKHASHGV